MEQQHDSENQPQTKLKNNDNNGKLNEKGFWSYKYFLDNFDESDSDSEDTDGMCIHSNCYYVSISFTFHFMVVEYLFSSSDSEETRDDDNEADRDVDNNGKHYYFRAIHHK